MWKGAPWTGRPWAGPPPAGSGDGLSPVHFFECTEEAPLCVFYSAIPENGNGTLLLTEAHDACADKIHYHPQQ